MKELVFNISDIFNTETQSGCLHQYGCQHYYIPSYQRGYKWSSDENGSVSTLLHDLWEAFCKSKDTNKKEYYLQYITVKPICINGIYYLEVIDGQQRLTTLSIMLSVLSLTMQIENIANKKLQYAIRENFFEHCIYNPLALEEVIHCSWEEFSLEPALDTQDIYYMHAACRKCSITFKSKEFSSQLSTFYDFLINNVKLIVNSVETHVESETVFKNLNSNKVPLTETELIKGLIITRIGRDTPRNKATNFQEVIEIRSNIGRKWDELSAWANRPEIRSFYFNNKTDAMRQLLALSIQEKEFNLNLLKQEGESHLFNFFLKEDQLADKFLKIVALKNTLDNWYAQTPIYNSLGYLRYHKGSNFNNLRFLKELLQEKTKTGVLKRLRMERRNVLKELNPLHLNYSEHNNEIHQILLSINVFVQGQDRIRFNFFEFEKENWTLEHIFPQTPEGNKNVLSEDDKSNIRRMLGVDLLSDEVDQILQLERRTDEQKEVYYSALRSHPSLNSLGNMCLLTSSDNSSNGNKFFDQKRQNILERIKLGSFVPRHTFEVFSKMFPGSDINQMKIWTVKDVKSHQSFISELLKFED